MLKIETLSVVPIPVGHRVSIRWHCIKKKKVFGGEDEESHPYEPIIEDLETGIIYAFDWPFVATGRVGPPNADVVQLSATMMPAVEEQRSVTGRITACRVFTLINAMNQSERSTQTELTIAPEDVPQAAYR